MNMQILVPLYGKVKTPCGRGLPLCKLLFKDCYVDLGKVLVPKITDLRRVYQTVFIASPLMHGN